MLYITSIKEERKRRSFKCTKWQIPCKALKTDLVIKAGWKATPNRHSCTGGQNNPTGSSWILNQIYEEDFMGFSYGFRPGRSQHNALDAIWVGITRRKVNWVLDADIRSFFDTVDHGWMMKFIEHRIADPRLLRLICKWLRAGVSEDGQWSKMTVGTPQGGLCKA